MTRSRQQHAALLASMADWTAQPHRPRHFTEGQNERPDGTTFCLLWTHRAFDDQPGWFWSSDASDLDAILGFDGDPDSLAGPYHTIEAAGEAALAQEG